MPSTVDLPPWTVRRSSKARRVRLTVTDAGEVVVVLPRHADEGEAERSVSRHAAWIERHVGRIRAERDGLASRPALEDGRVLVVDGRPLSVHPATGGPLPARGSVRVVAESLVVQAGNDGRSSAALLEAWLRVQARQVLVSRVARHATAMGVTPARLADPRSDQPLGVRFAPGHVVVQLAPHPGATRGARRGRRPRAGAPAPARPLARLLGAGRDARSTDAGGPALAAPAHPGASRGPGLSALGSAGAAQQRARRAKASRSSAKAWASVWTCGAACWGRELVRKSSTASSTSSRR